MKINSFTLLCVAFSIALMFSECSPYKSTSGLVDIKSLEPARITDSGLLYSTYTLTDAEKKELQEALSNEVIGLVEKHGSEEGWPEAIDDFKGREKVRPRIRDYAAFVLAGFDDKYVLIIPARMNRKLPEAMRPQKDIFFIIGKEGVEVQ